LDTLIVYYYC